MDSDLSSDLKSPLNNRTPVVPPFNPPAGEALAASAEGSSGTARNDLDGWQQIDILIGAGSEDGICGALEVARSRGLQPGPKLAEMGSPERPPTHSPDMEERRRVAAMLMAAQSEVRGRVREAEHTLPPAAR